MDLKNKKICIIGCGTFGSYLLKRLLEKYGNSIKIIVVEIGNKKTQTEKEIGIDSISENSSVASAGRYFGFGGTSARWGGQVLFFDERDNPENDDNWNKIIGINNKYKNIVLGKLLNIDFLTRSTEKSNNVKTGIWLKYNKRNIYNRLNRKELRKVTLLSNLRLVNFNLEKEKIKSIICKNKKGETEEIHADIFYLTAGALESCRLLLMLDKKYGILNQTDLGKNFGDHISTELFQIKNAPPFFNGIDLTPVFQKGSLVTKRIVVQSENGTIGFLHGIFNKDIKAFKFLKESLFGKKTTSVSFTEFIAGLAFLLKFGFYLLFKNKLYIDHGQWSLQLDMEQPTPNNHKLSLSDKKDEYGEAILKIDWSVSKKDLDTILEIRKKVEMVIKERKLEYTSLYNPASTDNKVEDVYHPSGCIRMGADKKAVVDFTGKVKGVENLYHYSTGIFPSAKSINPSAAVLCHLEKHLDE